MAEPILVNRTRFTSSLKNELMDDFNKLAAQTRIPKSRLLDEAVEDLLKKYEHKDGGAKLSRLCRPPPGERAAKRNARK